MKVRLIVISIILLMTSCAQQRSPSGGPRDTEPPKVLMANPLPMSTDFKAKRIEILFDEYVQLNGVRDQVLISPPLIDEPEISLKNSKRLIIDLGDQPLTKNTTYTVNLGEAIVDNNERNVLLENVYLFSTGSFIDSLQISGQILRAVYNDPCEFCMAMLFKGDVPDSSIIGNRPLYVAKADDSGRFLLSNLASGDYRLLAFDDLNSDLRIDENESFGFLDGLVKPSILDSSGTEVRISKAYSSEPDISFSEWALDGSYLTLSVKGLDSLSDFRGTASQNVLFIENLNNVGDSVRLWFSPLLDEDDELIIDFDEGSDTLRIGRVSEKDMDYQIQAIADLPNQEAEMEIQFSSPLSAVNFDLIQILRDSIPLDFKIAQELPSVRFSVNTEWQPGNYQLSLVPGAVIDIYGIENDSIFLSVQCKSPESFGNLTLNIDLPEPAPYILEMLDSQRQLQYEVQVEDDYTWNLDYLEPGAYVLRIYVDSDMNGRWSEGDFINEINPEPVFMLPEPITVRSNWEMDQDVKVEFKR